MAIKRIHLIFKTHLDVGFTDFARNVVAKYMEHDIPTALDVAEELRRAGSPHRFTWTTGSWLIYEYLQQAGPAERERMVRAIAAGDITWHGLPFTTHSELMDVELFRFGLSLSQELDARFGRKTIAAKMTDVPGHTIGIVPLLADAGIRFLHIGVNPASTPPAVPPVFVWRPADGAEVMVMYHKGSYGELMEVPGLEDAICFAHTGDNLGPQSAEQIEGIYAEMEARFPGVEVIGSTMDAFAAALETVKHTLPVITNEMGDTWIHGVGTDPTKVRQFRELLRLRLEWLKNGQVEPRDEAFKAFQRALLLIPEHTWGMDEKTHLADFEIYEAEAFQKARKQEHFRTFESSWQEQRDYLKQAVESLPAGLAEQAREAIAATEPKRPVLEGFTEVSDPAARMETAFFSLAFDPTTGAMISLKERASGWEWAGKGNPLGLFRYEVFSQEDYDRFYRQYNINKQRTWFWAVHDFTKPGMASASITHQDCTPESARLYRAETEEAEVFLLSLQMPAGLSQNFGCPKEVWAQWEFPKQQPSARVTLQWFDKPACRVAEAAWLSFSPAKCASDGWNLLKLGQEVSPLDVIRDGNRHLHAVNPGVRYADGQKRLAIDTLDAVLVAPGERSLLNFSNREPAPSKGMHFLLHNNIWGTNFPMWFEEDAQFRFELKMA